MAECGTPAGYRAHQRAGEPTCQDCRDAMSERARQRGGHKKREPIQCGTEAGYRAHRRRNEDPCADCREALRLARRTTPPDWVRPTAQCGTDSGYRRHRRRKEPACPDCLAAHVAAGRRRRPPTTSAKCGTRAGYCQHIRDNEDPCDPCADANRAYSREVDRRLRARKAAQAAQELTEIIPPANDQAEDVNWLARAICAGTPDPDIFYPQSAGDEAAALAICAQCPVKAACLEAALQTPAIHDHGVRGGLTDEQRRNLRRLQTSRAS